MYYTATETPFPATSASEWPRPATPDGPVHGHERPIRSVCQDDAYGPHRRSAATTAAASTRTSSRTLIGNSWLIWKSDGNHLSPPRARSIWSVPLTSDLSPSSTNPTPRSSRTTRRGRAASSRVPTWSMSRPPAAGRGVPTTSSTPGATRAPRPTPSDGRAVRAGRPAGCQDQSTSGPLLASEPGMSGPGGPDVFTLPAVRIPGQTVMAFAGWQGSTIGYLSCGIRPMYLADLSFGPNGRSRRRSPPTRPEAPRRLQSDLSRAADAPAWILAGRLRRRRLHLRFRRLLRLDRIHAAEQARRRAWRRRRTIRGTGWWRATAACSPSATPASTDRRAA